MKTPKRDNDDDAGLDSLLDTMTNVVGILVLVLIVTQLGVSDALTEITARAQVSQEDLEAARKRLETLEKEEQELEEQTNSLASFDLEAERERLNRLMQLLETRKKLLADQSKQANEFSMAIERDRKTAAQNKKKLEDTKAQRQKLQTELDAALKRRAELQALLDRTPKRSAPAPAKVVNIPNPRPAPPGARQVLLVCADDRIYPMNLDIFRKDAEIRAKQIITKFRLNLKPAEGIDPDKFEQYFTKIKPPVDDFFSAEYYVDGKRWPRMRLTPREGRGATEKELRRPGSRIRNLLGGLDPSKVYARVYVLPDSFNVYLTARQVLTEAGILAGWEPVPENWVYATSIGGGIELGPPRPPSPKKPLPKTPVKPPNVID